MTEPADAYAVVPTDASMADELAAIQEACFPAMSAPERMRAEHYRAHVAAFPEGQHAVVERETGRPVASATDFRTRVDFAHFQHRYMDAVGDNWLSTHERNGDWLYLADIGVHPAHRGRGLATRLHRASQALVRRLRLRGHVAGALPRDYARHAETLGIEAYVAAVVRGGMSDPVLTGHIRHGYHPYGIIPGYVDDPTCRGYGVFVVWRNPDLAIG